MGTGILVVGDGAREHALLWKLAQSGGTGALWCAPGNAGTVELAESVAVRGTDPDGMVAAVARLRVDLVVIGPEGPLAAGLADRLVEAGVRVCGPSRAASRIESSKSWAKGVMVDAGVATARAVVVTDLMAGLAALSSFGLPVVVKADGLAAGTGVVVAGSRDEARAVLTAFLEDDALGVAGRMVLIEEGLSGREVSVPVLTDGETMMPLPAAFESKRAFDGDRGPNTAGMGAYSPGSGFDRAGLDAVRSSIMEPTLRALARRGAPLRGVLAADLMLTADGPKTLEFNARFGDPGATAILPVLDADLGVLLGAVADGRLAEVPALGAPSGAAVAVVLVAGGYPGPYPSGAQIGGLERVPEDVLVFHGATRRDDEGRVVTAGGRVLTVVGRGADVAAARERAYAGAAAITFAGVRYRRDIALREVGGTA